MAKRGNIAMATVSTQEQWNTCLNKPGLSLFDIFSGCWGPCLAIQPTFKQLQMEFGDKLTIMLANTDNIEDLSQFRGTSQPLFLVYSAGIPVAILKGANQPKLLDLVRKCQQAQKENKKLVNIFEEATPEEEALARSMSKSSASASELTEFTLALIKPDAVKAGFVKDIINELNENSLMVVTQQEHLMTSEEVSRFYSSHTEEPYFMRLVEYMTSGPSVALVLAKVVPSERSVCEMLRELRGPKDVACAKQEKPESLRAKFGVQTETGVENAIHSSDDKNLALDELAFFFPNFKDDTAGLERTLCIIRPDTYKRHKEDILAKLAELEFKISLKREFTMSKIMAETFYSKQRNEPFFEALVNQMTSGPCLILALCCKNALKRWRDYLGPTIVSEAKEQAPDSFRATYSPDDLINGLHGTSSPEEVADELNYFFPAEQTLAVIKPDMADQKEEILGAIRAAGIVVQAAKTVTLSRDEAGNFYEEHKNKEFYGDLCSYMASGESTFLVLSAYNAVEKWREIIGPTDPNEAKETKPASLRSKMGKDVLNNGVHGSSSTGHALKTIELIFGESCSIRSSKTSISSSKVIEQKSHATDETASKDVVTDAGKQTEELKEDRAPPEKEESAKPGSPEPEEEGVKTPTNEETPPESEETAPAPQAEEQTEETAPAATEEPTTTQDEAPVQADEEQSPSEEQPSVTAEETADEKQPSVTAEPETNNNEVSVETENENEKQPPPPIIDQPNIESVEPSTTNMSEGLSPISEGQEDYFQDSFNSDSSALKDGRPADLSVTPMTPDQTGDEMEELPTDGKQPGTKETVKEPDQQEAATE